MVTAILLMTATTFLMLLVLIVVLAGRDSMRAVGEIMLTISVALIVGFIFRFELSGDFQGFLFSIIIGVLILFIGAVLKISGEIASERYIVRSVNRRILMQQIKPEAKKKSDEI